jgi:hypothetical protein
MLTELKKRRWLRALQIAKILFEHEGYHILYLQEIEAWIKGQEEKCQES